jgi:hypothetical protein
MLASSTKASQQCSGGRSPASSGQQIEDFLDRCIGTMIGRADEVIE